MTFNPIRLTSVHGRRLALSSSGAIMDAEGYAAVMKSTADVVQNSSALTFASHQVTQTSIAASATSVSAYGLVSVTSGVGTAAMAVDLPDPVAGVEIMVDIESSSSQVSFGAGTSLIHFASSGQIGAVDRTTLFIASTLAGGLRGSMITLVGRSTTQWILKNTEGVAFDSSLLSGANITIG